MLITRWISLITFWVVLVYIITKNAAFSGFYMSMYKSAKRSSLSAFSVVRISTKPRISAKSESSAKSPKKGILSPGKKSGCPGRLSVLLPRLFTLHGGAVKLFGYFERAFNSRKRSAARCFSRLKSNFSSGGIISPEIKYTCLP